MLYSSGSGSDTIGGGAGALGASTLSGTHFWVQVRPINTGDWPGGHRIGGIGHIASTT